MTDKVKTPKIIHYCWFGGNNLPDLAVKCIASWRKYLPDYEIKEWNETNFDVNIIPYTSQAYKAKKYAFVSDYARFWILYNYGGLYFDTDVELIKPIDDIIQRGPFMGCENDVKKANLLNVAPGLGLGAPAGLEIYKKLLAKYDSLSFELAGISNKQITIVQITTDLLLSKGLQSTKEIQEIEGIFIYPKEFFCPIDYLSGKCVITEKTRSIHHYAATWVGKKQKLFFFISKHISPSFASFCSKCFKLIVR